MASFGVFKVACVTMLFLCVLAAAPPRAEGVVTCGQVAASLSSCIKFLTGGGGAVPAPCCKGIKSLNIAAKTTPDRQATCKCLKTISGSIRSLNYGLAASLPGKCGVNIPFKISPSTDCNSVK